MSEKPKILVTSAAGRTGQAAVAMLLELGFPVRAFVRRHDARSANLKQLGAEIFAGDQFDLRDLRAAMRGIQRAYHCPPFAPNLAHNSMLFAMAAEEAKLEVVALLSGWNPHPTHPSIVTREHWLANNIYRWMPSVDVIHINPGLFAFTYLLGLPAIVHLGLLALPFGEGLNAPPSNEDIARVVVGTLIDPAPHVGKSYRPTGPELIAPTEVAGILSKILNRKVRYQDVPIKMFFKAAAAQGFPFFESSQVRYYAEELRANAFAVGAPTDHVKLVTGRNPESFETIARRYIENPALIHPALQVGSKPGALWFVLKMLTTRVPDPERWERRQGYPILKDPQLAHENEEWRARAEQKLLLLSGPSVP